MILNNTTLCAFGKDRVNVEMPVIRYITTGRLYIGIYTAEMITTAFRRQCGSQLLQQVGFWEV